MAYSITNSDSSITLSVADSTIDSTTLSLALVGRNVSNYGLYFAQNSLRHLENFASTVAPSASNKLTGQLWYDKATSTLRVYDGSTWKPVSSFPIGTAAPVSSYVAGTAYFNTLSDKLFVFDGARFRPAGYAGEVSSAYSSITNIGTPNNYGTKIRNIFLKDTAGVDRAVLALMYVNDSANGSINQGTTVTDGGKETIMAIFSDHSQFTIANSPSSSEGESRNWYPELIGVNGIGSLIKPGLNQRSEYATTAVALANVALQAVVANAVLIGATVVDGDDMVWNGGDYIPVNDNSTVLGSNNKRFAALYTGTIFLGNGTSGSLQVAGNVTLGNAANMLSHVYTTNLTAATITVTDNLLFTTANIGNTISRVQNSFFANIDTSALKVGVMNYPAIAGTNGQVLVTDGVSQATWESRSGDIEEVIAGAGLTGGGPNGSVTLNVGAGSGITVAADTVSLTGNVITTGAGTYGSNVLIPVISVDTFGRVTSIVTTSSSANVLGTVLTGFTLASTADVSASDNVIVAFGKIQAQLDAGGGGGGGNANVYPIIAGAGLTGGGSVAGSNVTLDIVGGTGIKVNTDNVVIDFANISTTQLSEGTNLYFSNARVLATPLTGYSASTNTALASADTVLQAFGKIQGQINARGTVASVTATLPILSSGGTTPDISMPPASSGVNGYLAGADWNTFNLKASTVSPTFTGVPVAPTAALNTNTTQLATTAFVLAQDTAVANSVANVYLPLAGGTVTGNLSVNGVILAKSAGTGAAIRVGANAELHVSSSVNTLAVKGVSNASIGYIQFGSDTNQLGQAGSAGLTWAGNPILHSGNYTTYTVTKTGTGASGSWAINITGNAASANTAANATYAVSAGSATSATSATTATSANTAIKASTVNDLNNAPTALTLWTGTQDQYNLIGSPSSATIYFVRPS